MPLPYHYSKSNELDAYIDTELGLQPKRCPFVVKSSSKSLARRSRNSLLFDYSIVMKAATYEEAFGEALFQSSLTPRTMITVFNEDTGERLARFKGGEQL